jgi:hypothetical protein
MTPSNPTQTAEARGWESRDADTSTLDAPELEVTPWYDVAATDRPAFGCREWWVTGRTDLEDIQDQLEFLNDAHDEQQK